MRITLIIISLKITTSFFLFFIKVYYCKNCNRISAYTYWLEKDGNIKNLGCLYLFSSFIYYFISFLKIPLLLRIDRECKIFLKDLPGSEY